jgi:hypothetical protein
MSDTLVFNSHYPVIAVREGGHDVGDWLNAERELRDASNSAAA